MKHGELVSRILVCVWCCALAAGCATKSYECTTGLVMAFPSDVTPTSGEFLFSTSSEALPGRPCRTEQVQWWGVVLATNTLAYDTVDFALYAMEDHFNRMHNLLLSDPEKVLGILQQNPIDLEPIWDVCPTNRDMTVKEEPEGLAQSSLWPRFANPTWYQDEDFTQLERAKALVQAQSPGAGQPPVRIGHIDTGYRPGHIGLPPHLRTDLSLDFTPKASLFGQPRPGAADRKEDSNPLLHAYGHGMGTLTVLASDHRIPYTERGVDKTSATLGAIPFAEVICVRARPTFMHFFPIRLARSIMYCVSNRTDVVSISQGGTSSLALSAAVNEAYLQGTMLVAASSDFIYPYLIPRAIPFRDMAYPARYQRVVAAAGLDGDYHSYGDNRWRAFGKYLLRPCRYLTDVGPLIVRGSYGPRHMMDNAVCGFSPNIPFADASCTNRFDLDGGGTSATTPQVAGAAGLWMQAHMNAFTNGTERWSWEKIEYAATALRRSASLLHVREAAYKKKFGHGYIKAADALALAPADLRPMISRKPPEQYPDYTNTAAVFTAIYLQSLKPADADRIGKVFAGTDGIRHLERFVGAYMRQSMVAREMFRPEAIEHNARLEKMLRDVLAQAPGTVDPGAMTAVARATADTFNCTAGKMNLWKRDRRVHDWIRGVFSRDVSAAAARCAIETRLKLEHAQRHDLQSYFEAGAGI